VLMPATAGIGRWLDPRNERGEEKHRAGSPAASIPGASGPPFNGVSAGAETQRKVRWRTDCGCATN
jgi:hypothetical protein